MEIPDSIALSHRQYRPAVQWQECFPGHSAEARGRLKLHSSVSHVSRVLSWFLGLRARSFLTQRRI